MRKIARWGKSTPPTGSAAVVSSPPQFKQKLYGLRECHSGPNAIVDIVYVHGLTGGRESTWRHENGVFWPEDLLKDDIPNSRVFTFGYDADIVHFWGGASQNDIQKHAMALCNSLAQVRELTTTSERPILFVVHSLGGLVVEDALTTARQTAEPRIQKISKSTLGIAFLGTPHCGSDLGEWATVSANFLDWFKKTNTNLLGVLQPNSEVLGRIQNAFQNMLRMEDGRINVTCFFEEMQLNVPGGSIMVVPPRSAIIAGYNYMGIHKNHGDLGKCADRDDFGYKCIVDELKIWMLKITPSAIAPRPVPRSIPVAPPASDSTSHTHRLPREVADPDAPIKDYMDLTPHLEEIRRPSPLPMLNEPIHNFPPYGGPIPRTEYTPFEGFYQKYGPEMSQWLSQNSQQIQQQLSSNQASFSRTRFPAPPASISAAQQEKATTAEQPQESQGEFHFFPDYTNALKRTRLPNPGSSSSAGRRENPSSSSSPGRSRPTETGRPADSGRPDVVMGGATFHGDIVNSGNGKIVQGIQQKAEGDITFSF